MVDTDNFGLTVEMLRLKINEEQVMRQLPQDEMSRFDLEEAQRRSQTMDREFEPPVPDVDFETEDVDDFLQMVRDRSHFFSDPSVDATLEYHMLVPAYVSLSAKAKGRTFVRWKNPTESDLVDVILTEKVPGIELPGRRNIYRVIAEIKKI